MKAEPRGSLQRAPVGSAAEHVGRWLRRWISAAPCTHVYVLILLVTTAIVRSLHPVLATELLRQTSTNLSQMETAAARVLFLSAFLLNGGRWAVELMVFGAVSVLLERWAGSWRWFVVVVAGHVGATLVTTIGIWAAVRSHRDAVQLARSIDVGVSYGLYSAAAFLTFGLARRSLRVGARVALVSMLGVALVREQSFTSAGHVVAICIGAATYVLLAPGLSRRPPFPPR